MSGAFSYNQISVVPGHLGRLRILSPASQIQQSEGCSGRGTSTAKLQCCPNAARRCLVFVESPPKAVAYSCPIADRGRFEQATSRFSDVDLQLAAPAAV